MVKKITYEKPWLATVSVNQEKVLMNSANFTTVVLTEDDTDVDSSWGEN